MEEQDKSNTFKKLLDRLQEDSWQLELLISGFAIFGLFYALEPITNKLQLAHFDNNQVFVNFLVIVYFSLQISIFNLLLHVLLRGLWIGSLGLRYVFGDIHFDQLNYSDQFTNYLKRKVGTFDDYISKLENTCSVIFALTFLLIFYVFSFFIIGFILVGFNIEVPDSMIGITRFIFIIFSIGVLLTVIDFITLGFLKKNKWVSKFYFPFYWVFSFLTLSFLYRPLVYNLLDNKYGRRISVALIPFYLLIYVVFHLQFQKSNFITKDIIMSSSSNIANGWNYQDAIDKDDNVFKGEFVIQSKVITEPFIRLIVPLTRKIEDALIEFNPNLKPIKDNRGLYFQSEISFFSNQKVPNEMNVEYLRTFEKKYRFKIDTTTYKTEFIVNYNKDELNLESYIGIHDLPEGKHTIELLCTKNSKSDSIDSTIKIPFWYYKD